MENDVVDFICEEKQEWRHCKLDLEKAHVDRYFLCSFGQDEILGKMDSMD